MFRRFWLSLIIRLFLIGVSISLVSFFWIKGFYPINLIIWIGISVALIFHTGYYIFKIFDGIEQYLIGLKNSDFSNVPLKYYKWGKLGRLKRILEEIRNQYKASEKKGFLENEKYQTAVSLAPVGILMWDSVGNVVIFNDSLKNQLGLEGVISTSRLQKLRPVLFNKLDNLEIGYAGLIEYEARGKTHKFSARKSQIKIDQNILTMIVLQRVNTEIENAESAAWDKLMKIMTHEIMNSITSVHSLSSTLGTLIENDDKENAMRAVKSIEKRSAGLLQFVRDYRTLSEIPSPHLETFKLAPFLDSFLEEVKHIQPQIKIGLIVSDKLIATADLEQLRLILTNLYLNSCAALEGHPNPTIEISARQNAEGRTTISFTDNGKGMEKAILESAFIPFYTTRKEGSGIGLPLSRQLTRAMGGSLVLQSEEHKGCVALISLRNTRQDKM